MTKKMFILLFMLIQTLVNSIAADRETIVSESLGTGKVFWVGQLRFNP